MGRLPQKQGQKGSQKWLQKLVNDSPGIINSQLQKKLQLPDSENITWYSPLTDDDFAEYQDQSFLNRLDINPSKVKLSDFWPKRGPVWDGLAKLDSGKIFLVEAKAHIPEMVSSGTGAGEKSIKLIGKSLAETKKYLGSKSPNDWSSTFYQYTNRLAHLYFLRVINNLPAYLVFINFVNDKEMEGPETAEEWQGAIEMLHSYLGIRKNKFSEFIIDLSIDINALT
jgi:hypothetical protein